MGSSHASQERVKFWREPQFCNLELLRAQYVTHSFGRHAHETYAIGIIQRGAEEFDYRGATHVAAAGSIALINPGEVHTGHAATEVGWTYRMLYPDVRLLQQAAGELHPKFSHGLPYFPAPVVQDPYISGLILRLHLALETSASRLEQDSRLLWTLTHLIARHAGDRPTLRSAGQESSTVRRLRDYLDTHFDHNSSLDELAAMVNLSPFYLLRTFRKQVGLPPHGYLNQVRLYQAKRMLAEGQPISDVAHATGFADQSHLTRQFKRMVGVTPGQYQQKSKIVQDS